MEGGGVNLNTGGCQFGRGGGVKLTPNNIDNKITDNQGDNTNTGIEVRSEPLAAVRAAGVYICAECKSICC